MKRNILIVEDQRMTKNLLEIYITQSEKYNLAGALTNADSALPFCKENQVDLILMDVMTELGVNGLDASERIKYDFPDIKIIVITSMPEASWLKRARAIGIESFWYKESDGETILSVIDRTLAGESIYPDTTPTVPIGNITNHDFSEHELRVLRELMTGDSNTEIAERLGIKADTVKFHIAKMLKKTGFRTRTELAIRARSLGIVIK